MPMTGMQVFFTDVEVQVDSTSLFVPGGDVNNWAVKVISFMAAAAGRYAPPTRSTARWPRASTGNLRRSIRGQVFMTTTRSVSMSLSASAPYVQYVHEGTAYQGYRYIYTTRGWLNKAEIDARFRRRFFAERGPGGQFLPRPNERGWWMPISGAHTPFAGPGGHATNFKLRVHGQRANPFLTDAYVTTARRHSSLPKKRFRRTLL